MYACLLPFLLAVSAASTRHFRVPVRQNFWQRRSGESRWRQTHGVLSFVRAVQTGSYQDQDHHSSSSSSPSLPLTLTMASSDPSSSRGHAAKGSGKKHSRKSKDAEAGPSDQLNSIRSHTRLPTSLQQSAPLAGARPPKSLSQIPDKKLRANLSSQVLSQRRAKEHALQADRLLHQGAVGEEAGMIETEGVMERTARLTQREIKEAVGIESATKSFSLDLSGGRGGVGLGPYRCHYTPNGRQLLLAGRSGHLASFDWQTGKLGCEIQVRETVRDATWLHNSSFFATAQKKHVFIYDSSGVEVHRLKDHIDVNRLEFLRYHFLLATVGSAGWLKYQDTSTGQLVTQHRTKLGACSTMAQNPLTAVIHLGHSNGTVTLWTPNMSTPALTLLAHHSPLQSIAISSRDGGKEMCTAGLEGGIKVWDCRMLGKGPVREWVSRRPANEVKYSQRGLLAAAWSTHVSLYNTSAPLSASTRAPPGPYLSHNFPQSAPLSLAFCPFEDVLGVGHSKGFDSLLIPGAGEARYDSMELDPFEGKTARREREVRGLLDKIQPDMISVDPSFLGRVQENGVKGRVGPREEGAGELKKAGILKAADGTPFARLSRMERLRLEGKADEGSDRAFKMSHLASSAADAAGQGSDDEDDDSSTDGEGVTSSTAPDGTVRVGTGEKKEKKKARGRNSTMKRYLRKKRGNVIDQNSVSGRSTAEDGMTSTPTPTR